MEPARTGSQGDIGVTQRAVVLIGLVLVTVATACSTNRATSEAGGPAAVAPQPVSRHGEFRRTVLLTGSLEAVSGHPIVVPRVPGWRVPVRWLLDDGALVKKGDRIVELDTTEAIGDLEQKRIALDRSVSELKQKEAEVVVTRADREFAVERTRVELEKAEIESAIPMDVLGRKKHEEAQIALERAQVAHAKACIDHESYLEAAERDLEVLRIAVETARREIERAEAALASMVLTSPADGIFVVGEHPWEGRRFQEGDSVWAGIEIAQIPDLSDMRVAAKLSDVDDGEIETGMRATCYLDTYPDHPISGAVLAITPVAQETDRSSLRRAFDVRVELADSDPQRMRPGMSVRVEIEAARRDDRVLVPRTAVEFGESPVALLAGGGETGIVLGECNAFECEVLDGLEPGVALRRRG